MISALKICPTCGSEIPADAPEGGCPGCLLESGLHLLADEAVAGRDLSAVASAKPDDPSHSDQARTAKQSDRLAAVLGELGDYELLEEVGRGGQGVVFRARQKSLNRIVALKVISLGQWASKAHLKRFRREAEAAASLAHPGIVPIYEVGERDGSCYFSMQFIEGGQLDEVVKRTPMSIRQSAEFVAKVARTVHYAHEHGILHRDIKPGNILLDQNGEPHLTDFGLARLVETESTVTRTLEVLGTPSYMAPEQATGKNAELTSATDVYGLGAVLYQLLTGHPPFAGGATYETIKLLLDTDPRPPRQLNPKIDRELSTICLKCLEKDPKRRYSSALALAQDLEHWLKHEPIQAKPSGLVTHSRKWVRRNPSTAVFATLLVALGASLGVVVWNRKSVPLIPKSVAVLPFENLSDDPDNAYFAEGIQQEILTRLASISDLKVISRTSTQRYQSKPNNLLQIAKQLGVANIVEGSVQKAADQVRVSVQLINAQTDSHLWAETFDRKLTDIFGVESEIAKRIAESLRAKLTGREEQALAVKPTNNQEAYDAYLRGLSFEARLRSSTQVGSSWEVAGFFERAVQLDPNFAIAWARLSRVDARLCFERNDATPARCEAANRALENAQRLEPNSSETLLSLGYYQYWVLRDYSAAETTFGRVSKMFPGSSEVSMALARVTRREGHWDESVVHFERALALDPRNIELLDDTARTYAELRQFRAALKLYDREQDITPSDPDVMASKASIYQAQGNLQEAASLLSEVNGQTRNEDTFFNKITQLRLERNYGEAVRLLQGRLDQFHFASQFEKAINQVVLALMQRLAGDRAESKVTVEQARNTLESLYRDQLDNEFFAIWLARAHAVGGEKDSAQKLAERAIMLLPPAKDAISGPGLEENLAAIQAIVGENSRAISTLTRLLQTPYDSWLYSPAPITPAHLRLDPIWDPLRADPAFQKLCEEKIDKSIAVLPFKNLSDEKENAYFADGIQDDILTNLSKIGDLKVISRTSVMSYRGNGARDAREIGRALGVATLLEGSVRRVGNRVRVNVQFINANNDEHIWAENYERGLTDIFAIQTDLAQKIAEALQAKLSPEEKTRIERKPTENGEAYMAFVLAHNLSGPYEDFEKLRQSEQLYDRAIELDPNFALAIARYSQLESWILKDRELTAERREKAENLADRALQLQPNLPEAHLARGFSYYYGDNNYDAALKEFQVAQSGLPNESEVYLAIGAIQRRQGKWAESTENLEKAVSLNPKDAWPLHNLTYNYWLLRDFTKANEAIDRAIALNPAALDPLNMRLGLAIVEKGDFSVAERAFEALKSLPLTEEQKLKVANERVNVFILERKYREALQAVEGLPDDQLAGLPEALSTKYYYLGLARKALDDEPRARAAFLKAKSALEERLKRSPNDERAHIQLAKALAFLGEKDAALAEAQRAAELLPETKDALGGPYITERVAEIHAIFGDSGRAIEILNGLLNRPSYVTVQSLRLNPIWDPLRADPRFQKLCEEEQNRTTNGH